MWDCEATGPVETRQLGTRVALVRCHWGKAKVCVTQKRSLALGRLHLVQGFLKCPRLSQLSQGSHTVLGNHTPAFLNTGPVCRRLMRADIAVGCSVASCRSYYSTGTSGCHCPWASPGQHRWLVLILLLRLHSQPMDFGEKAPVALHTRPALCAEMVWVRSGASLGKFLAGTEFFRVIADVCLCPDLFRPGRVRPLAAVTQTSDINSLSVVGELDSMSWS